jgi:hypothetical protein
LWVSAADYTAALNEITRNHGFWRRQPLLHPRGLVDRCLETIKARTAYYPSLVPDVPASYVRLLDGDTVTIGSGVAT